jgi:hypothetical protein
MGTGRKSAEKEKYKGKQECCRIEIMSLQNNVTSLLCLETRNDITTELVPYSRKPVTQFSPPQSVWIKKNPPLWGVR